MFDRVVTLYVPTPQNGQTDGNNSSAKTVLKHFVGLALKGLITFLGAMTSLPLIILYKGLLQIIKGTHGKNFIYHYPLANVV